MTPMINAASLHQVLHVLWWINAVAMLGLPFCFVWIVYFAVARPLDRKLPPMQNYTLERGAWFNSSIIRLVGYVSSALLQPYRGRKNGKLLGAIVRRRFAYQDLVYGQKVDIRKELTRGQLYLCYIWAWYTAYFFMAGVAYFVYVELGIS